jgi:hypothetical protein
MQGRPNTRVGLRAANHQAINSALLQQFVQVRTFKRVTELLMHYRFSIANSQSLRRAERH